MAWKAKIVSIVAQVFPPAPSYPSVNYIISVEFYDDANPTIKYTKEKIVQYTVTKNQVLTVIKNDLAELNAGRVFITTMEAHLNEEIDSTTTW